MKHASETGPVILYNKRRALQERAKGLSHLVPAMVLLGGLLAVLSGHEPLTLLIGIEVLVGVAYIGLLVREMLLLKRHGITHHEKVAWLELAAAGILGLEGYHIWHRHHETALRTGVHKVHILPWLYFGVSIWYVVMAFGMARLHERRFLHLHAAGFEGRMHPFRRRFQFHWKDVVRVEPDGPADAVVHLANGRQHRLSFTDMHDGAAHRDRLLAHARNQTSTPKQA